MILHVIDNKNSESSFVSNDTHIFPLLKEIAYTFSDDCVIENWAALLNHQQIEWSIAYKHTVSIRIDR